MTTTSNVADASASSAANRADAISSGGLGGIVPDGMTHSASISVCSTCSLSDPVLVRMCDSPTFSRPVTKAGRRMSASISSTDLPSRVKLYANAQAEVDLPSAGRVLVTSSVLGAPPSVTNCIAEAVDR